MTVTSNVHVLHLSGPLHWMIKTECPQALAYC